MKEESYMVRQKSVVLAIMSAIGAVAFSIIFFINFITIKDPLSLALNNTANATIVVGCSIILALLFRGRFRHAVAVGIVFVLFTMSYAILSQKASITSTGSTSSTYYLFVVITVTSFFASPRVLFLVSFIFILITNAFFSYLRISGRPPVNGHMTGYLIDINVSLILTIALSFLIKRITDQALATSEEELKKNRSLASNLEQIVEERTRQLLAANVILKERNRYIEDELEVARMIQSRLLTKDYPAVPGFRFYAFYLPVEKVGGDFYDFFRYGDSIGVFIADVSGHGLASSYLSLITKMSLAKTGESESPSSVLSRINRDLFQSTVNMRYVTCFLGIINSATRTMRFSNAGHFSPFVIRGDDAAVIELSANGKPLGWFESTEYEEKEMQLLEGDRIVLYTDGITECKSGREEFFGEARFIDFMRRHAKTGIGDISRILMRELHDFLGSERMDDDIAMVLIDVDGD